MTRAQSALHPWTGPSTVSRTTAEFKKLRASKLLAGARAHKAKKVMQVRNEQDPTVEAGGFIRETAEMELERHTTPAGAMRSVVESMMSEETMEAEVDETGGAAQGDSNENLVLGTFSRVIVSGPKIKKVGGPERNSRALSSVTKEGFYELDEKDSALFPDEKFPIGDELRHHSTSYPGDNLIDPMGKSLDNGFRFGTDGRFLCLDNIDKGASVLNRQSDRVVARRVRLNGSLSMQSFRASGRAPDVFGFDGMERTSTIRLMLVYDLDVKGVHPNASDLLEDYPFEAYSSHLADEIGTRHLFGGGPHPWSFAQRRNKRFLVLGDALKVCNRHGNDSVPPDARASGHPNDASFEFSFDVNMPGGLPLYYVKGSRSGVPSCKERGAFYLFAIANGRVHNTLMGDPYVDTNTQGTTGRGWWVNNLFFSLSFSESF